jgi:diguanylate cyclase (GGDEF)-like protein
MMLSRHRHHCAGRRRASPVSVAALALILTLLGGVARAGCLELSPPSTQPLQELSIRDPKKAIAAIKTEIDAASRATPVDESRIATLYAIEASSYSLLELDSQARSTALKGLEYAPLPNDSTHLTLQMVYAENVYDADGINAALSALEKARSVQLTGSRADLCLQITIGRVQNRGGRSDLALLTLTQAYRASLSLPVTEPRVAAAAALSPVMRAVSDYKQALALSQEVIDWDTKQHATMSLSTAHFLRGQILSEMHNYADAIEETQRARKLSVELSDQQGIGFADLATCQVRLELGELTPARTDCESALRVFSASHTVDVEKEAQTLLARLDLAENHPERALAALNDVLSRDAEQMSPRLVPLVYRLRAQANASLQKYPEAYRDLNEYVQRYKARTDAERAQQVASLRARFETDREIERNASLQRELALADERAQRQRAQLRWVVLGTGVSGLVIALLTYLLVSNRRYRRQLVQLATEDSLTGLPNRGRTAALATRALLLAFERREPLCIALIDLDRFKAINDRYGHAAGDRVLQEFATLARNSLRSADTLGRWGGEEFLLILPNTTLDVAVGMLDHLRLQAGLIVPAAEADLRVSISAGLAATGDELCSLDEIVARADLALYEAKNSGRDLVRYANSSALTAAAPDSPGRQTASRK